MHYQNLITKPAHDKRPVADDVPWASAVQPADIQIQSWYDARILFLLSWFRNAKVPRIFVDALRLPLQLSAKTLETTLDGLWVHFIWPVCIFNLCTTKMNIGRDFLLSILIRYCEVLLYFQMYSKALRCFQMLWDTFRCFQKLFRWIKMHSNGFQILSDSFFAKTNQKTVLNFALNYLNLVTTTL